ncbi:MAG: prolyl oligopeptidase family serine peptidase [Chloroherpetonaceae bacterium]|nr:prolyl oligopeptidase family serine peptidase [Chloroherpetonaceae bacterium]MDW8436677.1 PHB depolymerase family esterase [Chloroherpetonaceae bacterium]
MKKRSLIVLVSIVCASLTVVAKAQQAEATFEKHFFERRGLKIPYRLLSPRASSKEARYPLVLYLHGAGERGNDGSDLVLKHGALEFAKRQDRFPCYVLAPQCPKEMKWSPYQKELGYYRLADTASAIQEAVAELVKFIQSQRAVDSSRVYVVGLSMGGFGAWELAMRNPSLFAAAVPICGGGDATKARLIKHLPVWVFHGADDQIIKVQWSRQMVDSLKAAGGSPRYTEFPYVGHNAWSPAFATEELYEWLFAQKKR